MPGARFLNLVMKNKEIIKNFKLMIQIRVRNFVLVLTESKYFMQFNSFILILCP